MRIGKGDHSDLLQYCTRGKKGGLQVILTQNVKEIQQGEATMDYATGTSNTMPHISQMSLDPPLKTPLPCVFMKLQNLASGECQL